MKKINLLAAIAGVLATTALVAGITNASSNNTSNLKNKIGFAGNGQAIEQALENKDFASWKTAMEAIKTQLAAQITKLDANTNEDTFNKLVEAKQLMAAGKINEAKAVTDGLGLHGIPGMNFGMGEYKEGRNGKGEMRGMTDAQRTAINKAITNKDYTAWETAMGENNPMAQKINADNFVKFAEAHTLMQAGKFTEAQKIMQELGVSFGMGRGNGRFR
ncbi:MAG: hypothetical protein WCV41_02655 [Patescibacteria group bacterium]